MISVKYIFNIEEEEEEEEEEELLQLVLETLVLITLWELSQYVT